MTGIWTGKIEEEYVEGLPPWHLLLFSQYTIPMVSNFLKKSSEFVRGCNFKA
jgi:hypothetical protein